MHCPLCNATGTRTLYANPAMPYGTALPARTIDLRIDRCDACGFVFQSSAYDPGYDRDIETLYGNYKISDVYTFPNRNRANLEAVEFVSDALTDDPHFSVLEIGSNRGDFLYLLKERHPHISVLGCEPTAFEKLEVPTVHAFFTPGLFSARFDLVVMRHTLEHIKNPVAFAEGLFGLIKPGGNLFIEVPHLRNSLQEGIEDFTPDHVNYFTPASLQRLFRNFGAVKRDERGYLRMRFSPDAKPASSEDDDSDIPMLFERFTSRLDACVEAVKSHRRIVFYGVGNFYLWTHTRLATHLQGKQLFVKDDNVDSDRFFGLPKLERFEPGDLVVLCSSNVDVQEAMAASLPKSVSVLYPWRKVTNV